MPDEAMRECATINPYALAEVINGGPLNWSGPGGADAVFRKFFRLTRKQLLSPAHGSPVFAGLEPSTDGKDLVRISREAILDGISLGPRGLPATDAGFAKVRIPNVAQAWLTKLPLAARHRAIAHLLPAPEGNQAGDWNPPSGDWKDVGKYITDSKERTDPKQGAVGDCYFVAALASVALTHPSKILTATTSGPHTIKFHTGLGWKEYKVTEKIPVTAGGSIMYGRSTDSGEVWPAIYEKAYAQYRAGTKSDEPNYMKLSGGSGTTALHHITGFSTKIWYTALESASHLYDIVDDNSTGGKAVNPMVANTYPGDLFVPGKYEDVGLVANHVYSVFGHFTQDGKRYIVLRNPWASEAGDTNVASGTWSGLTLGSRGLFALRDSAFKSYFQGLGRAKN